MCCLVLTSTDLEPDALASVVPDKGDREQIILRAKNIPGISRKETFARKQALFEKREHAKKKETELRTSLVKAIQDPTQTVSPLFTPQTKHLVRKEVLRKNGR